MGDNGLGPDSVPIDQDRLAALEYKVDVLAWLHAELMFAMQVAAVRQYISSPEGAAALEAQLLQRMST